MLFLLFNDIMLKTSRWCKMRQIFSSQSLSSISNDEQCNTSSSASDEKSQCFEFHFRLKFISLKFLYVNAATQITLSISSKVCWDECRILINSELLSSSLINSWDSRSSLDSNIMNSTWYKKYVFYHSSSSCESFDALINDAKQVSIYKSSNENSQMQYLS